MRVEKVPIANVEECAIYTILLVLNGRHIRHIHSWDPSGNSVKCKGAVFINDPVSIVTKRIRFVQRSCSSHLMGRL